MSVLAPHGAVLDLLDAYQAVLARLLALAEWERDWLATTPGPLPLDRVHEREALAQEYARLTEAVVPHLPALHAAGHLNARALEERTRALVSLMKDNQNRLHARQGVTHRRVTLVMQAIAEHEAAHLSEPAVRRGARP